MPVIEVSNLHFSYSDEEVLTGIDLEVEKGDFLGVVGPNGSGKTTLMKLILGLEKPDTGQILVDGKEKNYQDLVGYVPQKYERDPHFPATVEELLNISGNGDLDIDLLEELEIDDLMGKKFVELSGGQQQRVMAAFALMKEPEILILDEPSVGVDVQAQEKFYNLLDRLNQEKDLTVIFVSHDIGVVSDKTDKVALINREICCTGTTDELPELMETAYGDEFKAFKHLHHSH